MEAHEIEKCVDEFGTDVYRFCLKLCMNQTDAEDLYQQTFLKALESDWKLDWGNNPKALFFSLTHNIWKSTIRKSARRSLIAPCTTIEDESISIRSDENIEENFLKKELQLEINHIIEALPDKIRVPLTLYYLFDFPIEQIAAMLKKPPGTIKSRLFKGRSLIKKRLEDFGYDEKG